MEDIRETLTAEIKELKKNQRWNRLDAMNARLEEAEEQISDTEDKITENSETEQQEEEL